MRLHFMIMALFLATGILTEITHIDSGKDVDTILKFDSKKSGKYGLGELVVGTDNSKSDRSTGIDTQFRFRTYGTGNYVGDMATATFGINCDKDKFSCVTTGAAAPCSEAEFATYKCKSATALLRFQHQKLQSAKTYGTFTFNLVEDSTFPNKLNIMSLGPKSSFWELVKSSYEKPEGSDFIETSLYYHNEKFSPFNTDFSDASDKNNKFIFNGRFGSTDPAVQEYKGTTTSGYVWEGATFDYTGTKTSVKVCVINDDDVLFYAKNGQTILDSINNQLCGAAAGVPCTPKTAGYDKKKVKQIYFGFKNLKEKDDLVKINFDPADFIFESADSTMTKILIKKKEDFTRPSGVTFESICGDADIAVGRTFLLKSEFIVRKFDDKLQIGFNETIPKNDKMYLIILIILAIFILATIITIVFIKTCKRNEETGDEDAYEQAKDTNA